MALEPPQGGPTMATTALTLLLVRPLFFFNLTATLSFEHISAASEWKSVTASS